MGRNNNYTTGNLLDYEYFSKHYKLIAIDLSKQIELENPDLKQQIHFIGRPERNNVFRHWKIRRNNFWVCTKRCHSCLILTTYKNGNSKDCVNLFGDVHNESSKFAARKRCYQWSK